MGLLPVVKASLLWAPGPLQSHLHQDGYDNLLVVMAGRKDVVYQRLRRHFPRVLGRFPTRFSAPHHPASATPSRKRHPRTRRVACSTWCSLPARSSDPDRGVHSDVVPDSRGPFRLISSAETETVYPEGFAYTAGISPV